VGSELGSRQHRYRNAVPLWGGSGRLWPNPGFAQCPLSSPSSGKTAVGRETVPVPGQLQEGGLRDQVDLWPVTPRPLGIGIQSVTSWLPTNSWLHASLVIRKALGEVSSNTFLLRSQDPDRPGWL